jgi:uncharacterized protein YjbI with pentapeptide repeats
MGASVDTFPQKLRVLLLVAAFFAVAAILGGQLIGVASVQITDKTEACPRIDLAHGPLATLVNKTADRGLKACSGASDDPSGEQQRRRERLLDNPECEGCILRQLSLNDERLIEAHFQGADLTGASLCRARLRGSHFEKSKLIGAKLIGAGLTDVHFEDALLMDAELEMAELVGTRLKGAQMRGARLAHAQFEPADIPAGNQLDDVTGLQSLCYIRSSKALHELRDAFKNAGMEMQEREVTYAIKRSERLHATSALERVIPYILYEALTEWGLSPLRPIIILFSLIPAFGILYAIAIASSMPAAAIWRIWDKDRPDKKLGQDEPERLNSENSQIYMYAIAFSLFSAFALGWKGASISAWIERLLPHEFTLKATGWPRVVAGLQSLLTLLLLAMTASPFWVH